MEAVAQAGTAAHDAAHSVIAASRAEKHGKDKRYFDLMADIVSKTISGEIMAVESYSEMVPLVASMSSYGVQPKADLRLRQDAPPASSTRAGTCC